MWIDLRDHLAHDLGLGLADGALKGDGLAVDVAFLHVIGIHDDKRANTAARQGLDAVRAHTPDADDHDAAFSEPLHTLDAKQAFEPIRTRFTVHVHDLIARAAEAARRG